VGRARAHARGEERRRGPDRAHTRFIVSNDADEVVDKIAWYVGLGFDHLVFHAPGEDQRRFLEQFCADVVPKLRGRF
jgi:coenzyme F420-dependent glucose-6-phosphate dehydrogenase